MSWRINLYIWKFVYWLSTIHANGFQFTKKIRWFNIYDVLDDEYEYMVQDDRIDIKNYYSMTASGEKDKERKRLLTKRRNWYVRHGFFDLAEDIDTCLIMVKTKT